MYYVYVLRKLGIYCPKLENYKKLAREIQIMGVCTKSMRNN